MVDALFEALGFKRIAKITGNVIEPVAFNEEKQCDICGDYDCESRECETGDGI